MASQGQHGVDQQRGAILGLSPRAWRWSSQLKFFHEDMLGQGGEETVMPAKVHVDEVAHEFRVRGDGGPGGQRVLHGRVLLDGGHVGRFVGMVAGAHVDQVRGAADVSRGAVFQAQLAHLAAQLGFEGGLRGRGRQGTAVVVFVGLVAIFLLDDGLGDGIEALTGADLADEVGDVVLGVVEDGLDEGLQGGVAGLQALDVLLVDALAAVVRVGVVDALGVVDGGAG